MVEQRIAIKMTPPNNSLRQRRLTGVITSRHFALAKGVLWNAAATIPSNPPPSRVTIPKARLPLRTSRGLPKRRQAGRIPHASRLSRRSLNPGARNATVSKESAPTFGARATCCRFHCCRCQPSTNFGPCSRVFPSYGDSMGSAAQFNCDVRARPANASPPSSASPPARSCSLCLSQGAPRSLPSIKSTRSAQSRQTVTRQSMDNYKMTAEASSYGRTPNSNFVFRTLTLSQYYCQAAERTA